MRKLLLTGLLCLMTGAGQAQSPTAFDFLRLETSARAAALGGTAIRMTDADVGAFLYNPALLQPELHRHASVTYLNHLSDLQVGIAAYAWDFGQLGTAAAGLRFVHWGTIPRADATGEVMGDFTASDLALTVGYARAWKHGLRFGINLHTVYATIAEYNALALAADLGVVWHHPEQLLTVAGAVSNLGLTSSSLGTSKDKLPVDVRVSVSKRLRYIPVLTALTIHSIQDAADVASASDAFRHAIFSLEFQAIPVFHIRLGYSHNRRNLKSESRLDLAGSRRGIRAAGPGNQA